MVTAAAVVAEKDLAVAEVRTVAEIRTEDVVRMEAAEEATAAAPVAVHSKEQVAAVVTVAINLVILLAIARRTAAKAFATTATNLVT